VAAACASTNGERAHQGNDAGVLDALADALGLDHVESDALAAEKPTVHELKCDKSKVAGGTTIWFTEQAFAGRSKADLARGSAIVCGYDGDYPCVQTGMAVRDGSVLISCTKPEYTVTLTMPPPL
jgi:hypothetical protein